MAQNDWETWGNLWVAIALEEEHRFWVRAGVNLRKEAQPGVYLDKYGRNYKPPMPKPELPYLGTMVPVKEPSEYRWVNKYKPWADARIDDGCRFNDFIYLVKKIVEIWANDVVDDSMRRAACLELYDQPLR